jgi:hypothetical protein
MGYLHVDLSEPETEENERTATRKRSRLHDRAPGQAEIVRLYPNRAPILRNLLAIRSEGRDRLPVTLVRLENRV